MPALEIYSLRPDPDGFTRVSCITLGEDVCRSWLVPAYEAEDLVLDQWARLHDLLLGYPPNW